MNEFEQIRAILTEEDAKSKQDKNKEATRMQTQAGKVPSAASAKKEVLKAPGVDEADKAGNATGRATPPGNDPKAKSSSKTTRLHQEEEEIDSDIESVDEEETDVTDDSDIHEGGDEKDGDEDDKDSDDSEGKDDKKSSKKADFLARMKKARGGKSDDKKDDKKVEESTTVDLTQHIDALFNGEALTEDFKNKAKTIFETALTEREADLREAISEEYETVIVEGIEAIEADLTEKLDGYLNYVVEKWMEDNKLEVENGLRTEIAESFLTGLRTLFLEHDIEVPETKVDLVDELGKKVAVLESRLNDEVAANITLNEKLEQFRKQEIVAELGEGLASTQFDRFIKLTEGIAFENDAEFRKKASVIKETYLGKKDAPKTKVLTETILDDASDPAATEETVEVSPVMEHYVTTLSRFKK